MTDKSLFIAWQDPRVSRQWYPIGKLDADVDGKRYRFRYTGGAKRAEKEVQFSPLVAFPSLEKDYRSPRLFSAFTNRVMWPSRLDFKNYVESLALTEESDPIDMMAVSGGRRVTDSYEVFPQLVKGPEGGFSCRFFLHGGKHVSKPAQERLDSLETNEGLHLALELTNPLGEIAVQLQTMDYQMIGWSPRYLARDLALALAQQPSSCQARVVRVNPLPVPSEERVLVELSGNLGDYEPMSGPDFQPIVPD